MFHQAVSILRAGHQTAEIGAYEMLFDGAVLAGTSVREAAAAVIERSRRASLPDSGGRDPLVPANGDLDRWHP